MLNDITLDTLSLDELITQAQAIERDVLWKRLDQWRLALLAKRKYGMGPAEFAREIGSCYSTMRERVALAEFYEPVWEAVQRELEQCETLYHKHLILAKRGLCEDPQGPTEALRRLRDWAATGISVEKAKWMVADEPDVPLLVKEFECTRFDLLPRIKDLLRTLDNDTLIVTIRKKKGSIAS